MTFRSYQPKHAQTSTVRRILASITRRGGVMVKSLFAGLALVACLLGGVRAAAATTGHTAAEIRSAAQSWVDRGAPYGQLTPDSQRLISRSTWTAWAACDGGAAQWTPSVRGHGNQLAVVRFTRGGVHGEWTAFYRDGQWTFELPGYDVARIHAHTPTEVSSCHA